MSKLIEQFAVRSLVEYDGELIFSKEKFAELIVRECATLAFDGPNGILEHFGLGVEE